MPTELTLHAASHVSVTKLIVGFVAGFLAVLFFHQPVLFGLHAIGFTAASAFSLHPSAPFGVPQVLSLSFWGGVWGVLFALIEGRFPRGARYWILAILFGAIFPSLVAWFVVFPLKGLPVAAGWHAKGLATGLLVNGAWGLGTALFMIAARDPPARAWARGRKGRRPKRY